MSDPFRDHVADKRAEKREQVRDEYTPLVCWVKTPDGEDPHDVLAWIQSELEDLPCVEVATSNTPYPYASDGVLRLESADGNRGEDT